MRQDQQELLDYQAQVSTNEDTFKRLLQRMRPDLYALLDMVDTTRLNPLVVFKIARQLLTIGQGTGYGEITIMIENGIVRFVNGEEKDRVNEPMFLPVVKADVDTT